MAFTPLNVALLVKDQVCDGVVASASVITIPKFVTFNIDDVIIEAFALKEASAIAEAAITPLVKLDNFIFLSDSMWNTWLIVYSNHTNAYIVPCFHLVVFAEYFVAFCRGDSESVK